MYCYYKKFSMQAISQLRLHINKFVATNLRHFTCDKSSFCALQHTTAQGLQSHSVVLYVYIQFASNIYKYK